MARLPGTASSPGTSRFSKGRRSWRYPVASTRVSEPSCCVSRARCAGVLVKALLLGDDSLVESPLFAPWTGSRKVLENVVVLVLCLARIPSARGHRLVQTPMRATRNTVESPGKGDPSSGLRSLLDGSSLSICTAEEVLLDTVAA